MIVGMDQHFRQSVALAVAAVRGADTARFGDPSPCTEFTVGKVVDHLAFGLLLAQLGAERKPFEPEWSEASQAPYLVGHPEAEWAELIAEQAEATAAAWANPRTWEGDTTFAGRDMPAAFVGSMMTAELALHGWDVAAATGQRVDVTPEHGAAVLAGVEEIAPMGREAGWFGAKVAVEPEASAFERALAASGRNPGWTS
jgi:uncharacterized protein (TIGR03086 family)